MMTSITCLFGGENVINDIVSGRYQNDLSGKEKGKAIGAMPTRYFHLPRQFSLTPITPD